MSNFSLREIIQYAQDFGLIGLLNELWKHLVYRHETQIITSRPLNEPILEIAPPTNIFFRSASINDIEMIRDALAEANWHRSVSRLRYWITNGDPFIVAEHDGLLIGYAVLSLKVFLRDRLLLRSIQNAIDIRSDDAWGADAFVRPSYRGKNIYPALAIELFKKGKKARVHRVLGAITVNNNSSRAAHKRLGCREICEVSFWRFLFFSGMRYRILNGGRYDSEDSQPVRDNPSSRNDGVSME